MPEQKLRKRPYTNYLVVHCSATRADMKVDAAWLDALHKSQGWHCIGYHYVVHRDGVIEVGRPEDTIGSHVRGHNSESIGVCLVGGIDKRGVAEDNFTRKQMDSLANLLRQLRAKYPAAEILGHRDLSKDKDGDGELEPHEWVKVCPSFDVRAWLSTVGIEARPNR